MFYILLYRTFFIMKEINNYRFLIPVTNDSSDWMFEHFGKEYISSDGNPVLDESFEEGYLVTIKQYNEIPDYIFDDLIVYTLDERFDTVNDFMTEYLDGDIEDNDFHIFVRKD